MPEWQKVFQDDQLYKAEMVKSILDSHKLNPVLINKRDSSYNAFGFFEVLVPPDHVIKALKVINEQTSFE
jgi:hypothetical protein